MQAQRDVAAMRRNSTMKHGMRRESEPVENLIEGVAQAEKQQRLLSRRQNLPRGVGGGDYGKCHVMPRHATSCHATPDSSAVYTATPATPDLNKRSAVAWSPPQSHAPPRSEPLSAAVTGRASRRQTPRRRSRCRRCRLT